MAKNRSLNNAGIARQDEFYTRLTDIEKELRHYRNHFAGKIVFCNCDDPFESNFFRYFVMNFNRLHLKQLICTCYAGSPVMGQQMTFADILGRPETPSDKPYKAVVNKVYDITGDGAIDLNDIVELFRAGENTLTELDADGDFRSDECVEILDLADIVVTNPPFSLFKEYISQLIEHEKKFIIIGSKNAITYRDFFPLLRDGKLWTGYGFSGGDAYFMIPPENARDFADGVYDPEHGLVHFRNVTWYTNMDINRRHEDLILTKRYDPELYEKYDNYDAINVNRLVDIPYDYDGVMGVPITIIEHHNPDQFEIIGLTAGNIKGLAGIPTSTGKDGPYINGKLKYGRVLIRNKHPEAI